MKRQKLGAFHTLLRELRVSDRTVTNIQALLLGSVESFESELKLLWDTFRLQIAELWFPYDRRIANDRRRSQKIEHVSIFCDRLRSRSQDRRRSQTIAEVGFHMIADDRRTFCDLRSSAIIWKPALTYCGYL